MERQNQVNSRIRDLMTKFLVTVILKNIKKNITPDMVEKAVKMAKAAGVHVKVARGGVEHAI